MQKNVRFIRLLFGVLLFTTGCREDAVPEHQGYNINEVVLTYPRPDENAGANEFHRYAALQIDRGNHEEGLHYATLAYEKAREDGDEQLIAKLLNNIGLAHWKLGDDRHAWDSYEEAGRIAEKQNMAHLLALTYTNRALILRNEEAYKTAKSLNGKAIAILVKLNAGRDLAIAYNNYGQIFKVQSQLDSAYHYYRMAAAIYDTVDYKDGKAATYGNIAEVYASTNLPEDAIRYARQSVELAKDAEDKGRISEGYKRLSTVYSQFQVLDSALKYQRKYADLKDEIFEATLSDKLAEYQGRLGNELQKLRIESLEQQKSITRSRIWMIAGGVFIILLSSAFLAYRRFSRERARKQQLETALEHSRQILNVKERELVSYILDVSRKNAKIAELQEHLSAEFAPFEERINELIQHKILTDDDWSLFKAKFSNLYPNLLSRVTNSKFALTEAEVRYLMLHYLKLSPRQMAGALGVSDTTIHKYKMRVKKKLQIAGYGSVEDFMVQF